MEEQILLEHWIKQVLEDPELELFFLDWFEDQGFPRDLWTTIRDTYQLWESQTGRPGEYFFANSEAYGNTRKGNIFVPKHILEKTKPTYVTPEKKYLYYFESEAQAWTQLLLAIRSSSIGSNKSSKTQA